MKKTKKVIYASYFLIHVITTLTILISLLRVNLDDTNFVQLTINYIVFLIISGIFVTFDYRIKFINKYYIAFYLSFLIIIPLLLVYSNFVLVISAIIVFILASIIKAYQIANKQIIESDVSKILDYNKLFFISLLLLLIINLTNSSLYITSVLLIVFIFSSEILTFIHVRKLVNNYDYIFIGELLLTIILLLLSYQGSINLSVKNGSFDILKNAIYPLGALIITLAISYHNKLRVNQIYKDISIE